MEKTKNPASGMPASAWMQIIILSAVWGGSFLFGRIAAQEVPALAIALARVLIAATVLWAFLLLSRRPLPVIDRQLVVALLVMGLVNNAIPFSLIFWGQKEIGAGLASIFNAMTPLFTVIFAQFATRDERITPLKLAGIATGIAGVAVLVGDGLGAGLERHVAAELAVLGAAASYGIAGVWGRRFAKVDPVFVATGQLSASSAILAVPALFAAAGSMQSAPSTQAILAIVTLAVLCTAAAYVLFFRILAVAGATNTALVTFLVPVSAILLGWLFLGERLSSHEFAGMGLIACALILVDGGMLRRLKAR
jgi:drug/metabolite transporter (DMT)-like permease